MITIYKEDFERALPVGVSAHDEVFESVMPAIDSTLDRYCSNMLGEAGIKLVTETDEESALKFYFKKLVCIDAFLSVLRQLDLVLTPTGFGIVSNDNVSPASKQRVDALEGSLRTALCMARAVMVDRLRSAEWGTTNEAKVYIRYVYTEHYFFFSPKASPARSHTDWQNMQNTINYADEQLRLRFGDEQMDDILDALRCNDLHRMIAYAGAMQLMCDFTDRWATMGAAAKDSPLFRRLEREIEGDAGTFALYHGSSAYKAAHVPVFENKKDSTAFVFNG